MAVRIQRALVPAAATALRQHAPAAVAAARAAQACLARTPMPSMRLDQRRFAPALPVAAAPSWRAAARVALQLRCASSVPPRFQKPLAPFEEDLSGHPESIREHIVEHMDEVKRRLIRVQEQLKEPSRFEKSILEDIDWITSRFISARFPELSNAELHTFQGECHALKQKLDAIAALFEMKESEEAKRKLFDNIEACYRLKSELMQKEQAFLHTDPAFKCYLGKLEECFKQEPVRSVYFIYAWPHAQKNWVHPFLSNLYDQLGSVGNKRIDFDKRTVQPGGNIDERMIESIKNDFLLIFMTPTFLEKSKEFGRAVRVELGMIPDKKRADKKKGRVGVIPFLIAGSEKTAVPIEYRIREPGYSDWREDSYLKHFSRLVIQLFRHRYEDKEGVLQKLWDSSPDEVRLPAEKQLAVFKDQRDRVQEMIDTRNFEDLDGFSVKRSATEQAELVSKTLRDQALAQSVLPVLTFDPAGKWQEKLPLDKLYCRLAMITDEQRKSDQCSDTIDGRLPTYETILREKNEVDPQELFKGNTKRALVYGAAGVGKTTFTTMLQHRWAKKQLFPQFKAVFVVRLRNLSEQMYAKEATTLYDILKREHPALNFDFKQALEDPEFARNSLLILDGWDELPRAAQRGGHLHAPFEELQGLFQHVIVTSRPGSVDFDQQAEFEILGFSASQIEKYVDTYFREIGESEKAAPFNRWLKQSPLPYSSAHIPIQLSMLCGLYWSGDSIFKDGETFSTSVLYERMLNQFLKMYLMRTQPNPSWQRRSDFTRLKAVQPLLQSLEEIAMQAMKRGSLYVDASTIEGIEGDADLAPDALRNLGLFSVEHDKGSFIHLSFQEYFAARYLARLHGSEATHSEALERVSEHKFDLRFQLVFPMLAGILAQDTAARQAFFDHLYAEPRDLARSFELTQLARCFEECRNPEGISQHGGFIEEVVSFIPQHLKNGNLEPLLRGNRQLMSHESITKLFLDMIQIRCGETQSVLAGYTSGTHSMPERLLNALTKRGNVMTAQILGNCGRERELIDLLTDIDESGHTRRSAATAIGHIASRQGRVNIETLRILIDHLKNQSVGGEGRGVAAMALGHVVSAGLELGDNGVEALVDFLNSRDIDRMDRRYAAEALGKVIFQGVELGRDVLKSVIEMLKDEKIDGLDHHYAAQALAIVSSQGIEFDSEVLKTIIRILIEDSTDHHDRSYAAKALREITSQRTKVDHKTLADLVDYLRGNEKNYFHQRFAAKALGDIASSGKEHDCDVVGELVKYLKNDFTDVLCRRFAIKALRNIADLEEGIDGDAVDVLLDVVRSEKTNRTCVVGQTMVDAKKVIDELADVIREKTKDSFIRIDATKALSKIASVGVRLDNDDICALVGFFQTGKVQEDDGGRLARAFGEIVSQGLELDRSSQAAILGVLRNNKMRGSDHRFAAEAIVEIASQGLEMNSDVVKEVVAFLRDEGMDAYARSSAARALGKIASTGSVLSRDATKAVVDFLTDERAASFRREIAAEALDEITFKQVEIESNILNAVTDFLRENKVDGSDYPGVARGRHYAAEAIGKIALQGGELDADAIQAAVDFLKDDRLDVLARRFAAKALGEIAQARELDIDAIKALVTFFEDSTDELVLDALRSINEDNLRKIYLRDPSLVQDLCRATNRSIYFSNGIICISGQLK